MVAVVFQAFSEEKAAEKRGRKLRRDTIIPSNREEKHEETSENRNEIEAETYNEKNEVFQIKSVLHEQKPPIIQAVKESGNLLKSPHSQIQLPSINISSLENDASSKQNKENTKIDSQPLEIILLDEKINDSSAKQRVLKVSPHKPY